MIKGFFATNGRDVVTGELTKGKVERALCAKVTPW